MNNLSNNHSKKIFMTVLVVFGLLGYLAFLFMNDFLFVYEFPVISFLLFLWFVGTIAISRSKEWGRKLIVVTSSFICFYFMFNLSAFTHSTISLILIIVVLMMYYILPKTKTQFLQ